MALPKETATRQFDGFVLAKVRPEDVDRLKARLKEVNKETIELMKGEPPASPIIPFEKLRTIHYARFVVLEHDRKTGPMLAFSTNYDGPEGEDACSRSRARDHHIQELVREAEPGLDSIFQYCEGYKKGELRRFLSKQQVAATFYVGSSGRSRDQIRWEAAFRRDVEKVLDDNADEFKGLTPRAIRSRVSEELKAQYPVIPTFPPQPDLTGKVRRVQYIVGAVALAVLVGAFFLAWQFLPIPHSFLEGTILDDAICIAAILGVELLILGAPIAALAAYFRHLEKTDPQFQPTFDEKTHEHFAKVSEGENLFLQNQLTHMVQLKPGLLRWFLIRLVFSGLQLLATNQYNKGKLGDIPSIHFARWLLLPHGAVLFFSNFDNSWQSYLGDFIDQASSGLTAVWSNTVGYPRTTWLLKAGSRDASRFLAWTRAHQLPTQVWYVAYPGLSIVNINNNTEIRRGLATPKDLDATTWLFYLRSVDRRAADDIHSDARAGEAPLVTRDIQGMILKGLSFRPEARYLMMRLDDEAQAHPDRVRTFLHGIWLTSAADATRAMRPPDPLYNVAFTYDGLRAIGLDPDLCNAFPTPFTQGSHNKYRALVNGDVGPSAPEQWRWGGTEATMPHVLVAIFGQKEATGAGESRVESVDTYASRFLAEASGVGLVLIGDKPLQGTTNQDRKEHFGFRDGIGQPTVRGSGRVEEVGNTIEPGEILLGHANGYGNIASSPTSTSGFNFGFNGSYLVFRQLKQDVEAFWAYCKKDKDADGAIVEAAKMVGRWPSGASLVRHPEKDPADARFADENNFSYQSNDWNNDRYGARCPFGAHIRRSNPRDWELAATPPESLRLANLHRIIRRGRPYGPPLDADMNTRAMIAKSTAHGSGGGEPVERGLQFICFNADIDRQFEFVQQQWCNNPKFAGLVSDGDPLLGSGHTPQELGLDGRNFTPQTDVRKKVEAQKTEMQRFVTVVGSAYFFMPSIPAMELLDSPYLLPGPEVKELEKVPDDEQLYIESSIESFRTKMSADYAGKDTLRAAHPKMHGCVRATFTVEPDLDEELRIGVFGKNRPGTYQAYVRFSNSSETPQDDSKPDIRGVAIKLLGVKGWKLLDGEERDETQDFLLISHNRFILPDVKAFSGFAQAISTGTVPGFMLRNPSVLLRALKALGKHSSPLEIPYWSAVPYLLGKQAVKYKLRPTGNEKTPIPAKPGPDYLHDVMWQRLGSGPVSFDFMVQVQPRRDPKLIEDATVEWSEKEIPFVKVATLTIPSQKLADSEALQEQGEDMSFNPWRSLPEHRPLGGLSRARRQAYRALSAFRHLRNAATDTTDRPADPASMKAKMPSVKAAQG